ncbi:MAG TPA: hypothetical protein V6D00_04095 [Pantanalinema sp.]
MAVDLESEAGLTLLELVLALSLSTAFLSAFFIGYRTFGQSLGMVASELASGNDGVEVVERMAAELDQATTMVPPTPLVVDFRTPTSRIVYRMAQQPGSPGFGVLTRTEYVPPGNPVGVSTTVGPQRAIANYDPFRVGVKDFDNAPALIAPLFSNLAADPPSIQIQLILQPTRESTPVYVRRVAAPRAWR